MATDLAAQLAQIAAKSKSSLNVKAQKAAHSKSLIFEPREAASQSYQTIFSICHEGFEDLCRLDTRFAPFASTLFSDQSQDEDRTQFTTAENAQLDERIEHFLRLSGSRLQLMPAIKAIEWLIRRFRIHEFNTAAVISTFLPYHTLPLFETLMSILPAQKIPHPYRFLDPYIRSLTAPPRAAIVHQATHHSEVLTVISTYTLEACRAQLHYPALISFWAGVMTEAVNAMSDRMKSGRRSIQDENDRVLLQQIEPTLGEALIMKKIPDIQIAAYMVTAVLASKGSLNDAALTAFMEQIVLGWTSASVRPGLVCLSILAQFRAAKQLPRKLTKSLVKVQDLPALLAAMHMTHRVDKLANGLCISLIDRLHKGDARALPVIHSIILKRLLQDKQMEVLFKSLLLAAHRINGETDPDGRIRKQLGDLLVGVSQADDETGELINKVFKDLDFDVEELELKLGTSIATRKSLPQPQEVMDLDSLPAASIGERESLDAQIERLTAEAPTISSFLRSNCDSIFDKLAQLFLSCTASEPQQGRLRQLPLLRQDAASTSSTFYSFFMRLWCTPVPTLTRVAALHATRDNLKSTDNVETDYQAIVPYCVVALADPSRKVRRAAAELLMVLQRFFPEGKKTVQQTPAWGFTDLYDTAEAVKWLKPGVCSSFLHAVLMPNLEESVLHEGHITVVLKNNIESSHKSSTEKEKSKAGHMSQSSRLAILESLTAHTILSTLPLVKSRFLTSLNHIRGVSSTSRTALLLPVLRWWSQLNTQQTIEFAAGAVTIEEMDLRCVETVIPNDKDGLECLFAIAQGSQANERPSLVRSIFARLGSMWPHMKGGSKTLTAETMLALSQASGSVAREAAGLLRTVDLTTDILLFFLESLQHSARTAAERPPQKRRRLVSQGDANGAGTDTSPELTAAINKATFVLQLVEESQPAQHPQLLPHLFSTLADLQVLRTVVGSELGYLQSLVLRSLLAMMPSYQKDKDLKIDASVGHGEILVNCVQKSTSPDVQNTALLLVASLAKAAPEVVLHSVMPIFTYMGGSVLRQSDDYSAKVIRQTIREVVPPLIETFRTGRRNPIASASDMLSSFVTAYEHIPTHRKHGLFISLIENLGPAEFLFAILAMLVQKYGTTDNIVSFSSGIMNSFNVEVQLQTLVQLLDLIGDIFKPRPTLSAIILGSKNENDEVPDQLALKQLTLLPRLLSNRRLKGDIGELADRDDMEAAKIRELYAKLLEDILTLADSVKTKPDLHTKCGDALSNLLNLLSIGEFIKAVENLLDRPNVALRQKVLLSLEVRVDNESNTDAKSRTALLAFLPQLTAVIRESDDIHYKHTAVACVDKISEKYGKKDIEAVAAAAATIAGGHCLGQSDQRLRVMALLCLASLVDVLQDGIVSVLPAAIPTTLAYLKESSKKDAADVRLHNAGYALVSSLAQHLPYMLSGAYLDEILAISNISAEADLGLEASEGRLQCLEFLSKQVDAKVMFTALEKNWSGATQAGPLAIRQFLSTLGMSIDKHAKAAISKNVTPLAAIFLAVFDLRRMEQFGEVSGCAASDLDEIETVVNDVALRMIYKLNDASFRPIFAQLMEWASAPLPGKNRLGQILRQQSVYGFLDAFFGHLKSIVTSYATYVVDSAVKALMEVDPKAAEARELWRRVIRALRQCFEHDQDGFWTAPAHFDAAAVALVAQFLHAPALDAADEQQQLVSAVVELAAAADSQEHRKDLNASLLRHLRHEHAAVRLAAVRGQQALTDRLGEEWLAMLPEMLPFISELQDDDDERVETETHRWIVGIEGVLGESLDSMLQ